MSDPNPNALCWGETFPDGEQRTYKMRFYSSPDLDAPDGQNEYVVIRWAGCDASVVIPRHVLAVADQQGWEQRRDRPTGDEEVES